MHPVQEYRIAVGLTRAELAEYTGLNVSTISQIEDGSSPYRTHRAVADILAEAFDCHVEELFRETELSHLGRPPLTGRPISASFSIETTVVMSDGTRVTSRYEERECYTACPCCGIVLPLTGQCDTCDSPD